MSVQHSETIAALAADLAAAQSEIRGVAKDRTNPHFKNKYATLDAIMTEVRHKLAKHGLAIVQGCTAPHVDEGRVIGFGVTTTLVHKSGEWMANTVFMPVAKQSAQDAGSALTYGRRYGVSALLALATDDDDDGNAASADEKPNQARSPRSNLVTPKQADLLAKLANSSVLTEREQARLRGVVDREKAKAAIDWATATIAERKAAQKAEAVENDAEDEVEPAEVEWLDGSAEAAA